jgi:hypothetical protein
VQAHRVVRRRDSHIFYTVGSQMAERSALYPQKDSWYSFQCHSADGRIMPIDKFSDLIGNRTRHLLACSVVFKPITQARVSLSLIFVYTYAIILSVRCSYDMTFLILFLRSYFSLFPGVYEHFCPYFQIFSIRIFGVKHHIL